MPVGNSNGLPDHADFNAVLRRYDDRRDRDGRLFQARKPAHTLERVAGVQSKIRRRYINVLTNSVGILVSHIVTQIVSRNLAHSPPFAWRKGSASRGNVRIDHPATIVDADRHFVRATFAPDNLSQQMCQRSVAADFRHRQLVVLRMKATLVAADYDFLSWIAGKHSIGHRLSLQVSHARHAI